MAIQNATLTGVGETLALKNAEFSFVNPPLITALNSTIQTLQGAVRTLPDPSKTMRPNMGVEHIPIQSITTLQIHFAEKPYDEEIEAINAYWEALEDDAEEAVSFKTKEQLQAEREADEAAKLAYARAKLKSFGLTDAEIDALKGS